MDLKLPATLGIVQEPRILQCKENDTQQGQLLPFHQGGKGKESLTEHKNRRRLLTPCQPLCFARDLFCPYDYRETIKHQESYWRKETIPAP